MSFWDSFWNIMWIFFWSFAFIAYLMALFAVITDLFRDHKLNGWLKALWIIFLIFVPFLTVLVYVIARAPGMNERAEQRARAVPVRDQRATSATSPAPVRPMRSPRPRPCSTTAPSPPTSTPPSKRVR